MSIGGEQTLQDFLRSFPHQPVKQWKRKTKDLIMDHKAASNRTL